MKTVGVIGGLGSETGFQFSLFVNERVKQTIKTQPHLIVDNLPVSISAEEECIKGGPSKEHLFLLKESVKRFNTLNVDCIVIACNSVHIFIEELKKISKKPLLSIVEETVKVCEKENFHTIGILSSTQTISSGLYNTPLRKRGIKVLTPSTKEQQWLNDCIIRIINKSTMVSDKKKLLNIVDRLQNKGAEAIIIGCTDLPLFIEEKEISLPTLNTLHILENATIEFFLK